MTPEEIAREIVRPWSLDPDLIRAVAAALAASEQRVDQAQLRGHQQSDQEWVAEYAKVRDERDDLRAKLQASEQRVRDAEIRVDAYSATCRILEDAKEASEQACEQAGLLADELSHRLEASERAYEERQQVHHQELAECSEHWQAKLRALERVREAGGFLWTVVANVSGGDWNKQIPEWRDAAGRSRDYWFAALASPGSPQEKGKGHEKG